MTPEDQKMLESVNESLWDELDSVKEISGYNEYCAGKTGSRFTLLGWLKHLKYMQGKCIQYKEAYENMKEFAEANGLDTTTTNKST